jgi:uncharacterized repeat protein (TIGR04002 family)
MKMSNKNKKHIKNLTYTSILAALIFVSTSFLSIPLPLMGYVHLGDGFVFLSAAILPTPFAIAAAIIGAGAADLMAGYALYIPATLLIKALMTLFVTSKGEKITSAKNLLGAFIASIVNALGYYIYEVIIMKSFVAPAASIPLNFAQSLCGFVVFFVFGKLLEKNKKLLGRNDV